MCITGLGEFPKYPKKNKKTLVIDLFFWLHLGDGACTDNSMRIIETSIRALPGVEEIDIAMEQKKIPLSYRQSDVSMSQDLKNLFK